MKSNSLNTVSFHSNKTEGNQLDESSIEFSKKVFSDSDELTLESIVDNLIDRSNAHGVSVAHDAAVSDNNE